jgi:hypothetical protein
MGLLVSLLAAAILTAISFNRASNKAPEFQALTACTAVVLLGILIHRVWRIRKIFTTGEVVLGHVLATDVDADNVHSAIVAYRFRDREYKVKNVIEGTGRVFDEGDTVELVIDLDEPSRAYIKSLFV